MVGHRRGTGKPLGPVATVRRRRALTRARAAGDHWSPRLAAAFDHVRAALRDLDRRDPGTAAGLAADLADRIEGAAADIDHTLSRRKAG